MRTDVKAAHTSSTKNTSAFQIAEEIEPKLRNMDGDDDADLQLVDDQLEFSQQCLALYVFYGQGAL